MVKKDWRIRDWILLVVIIMSFVMVGYVLISALFFDGFKGETTFADGCVFPCFVELDGCIPEHGDFDPWVCNEDKSDCYTIEHPCEKIWRDCLKEEC